MNIDLDEIEDIELEGIDTNDYPDFCDAYVSSAVYEGRNMTSDELDWLNDQNDWVYDQVLNDMF